MCDDRGNNKTYSLSDKEKQSRIEESYVIKDGMSTLEAPNYTRPEEVYGMKVPKVLLT